MRHGLGCAWILVGLSVAAAPDDGGPTRNAVVATADPLGEPVQNVVYLDQGWSPSRSLDFYFTSQGSLIVPYDWFLALEQPDSSKPFRDNQNVLRFRYLPQLPTAQNPDGLPVGFVGADDRVRKWVGLTCAACHTSEIRYGSTGYRVDGAPTQGDIRALLSSLIEALQKTLADPQKFDRFASQVLKSQDQPPMRELLKQQVAEMVRIRVGYNQRNFPGYDPAKPAPPPDNYGRLDAIGAIVNETYYHAQKSPDDPTATSKPANASVSYPFLWDTPGQSLVQWVGLPNGGLNTLARNVGEVLGVFASYEVPKELFFLGYPSSVEVTKLLDLERWVEDLKSPQWPAAFPKIDQAAAQKGKALYATNCLNCHVSIDRSVHNPTNEAKTWAVGTDPLTYNNVFKRTGPSGRLNGQFANVVDINSRETIPAEADALTMLTNEVIGTILGNWREAPTDPLSKIDLRKKPELAAIFADAANAPKYKGRALDGIWATAPYLHNGSVPNLYELLLPAKDRSKSFSIGARTFDPQRVGFVTDAAGFPKFNVNDAAGNPIPGNSNAGHEYGGALSAQDRAALLEYLKTL